MMHSGGCRGRERAEVDLWGEEVLRHREPYQNEEEVWSDSTVLILRQ